jgi:hypothetical protein
MIYAASGVYVGDKHDAQSSWTQSKIHHNH